MVIQITQWNWEQMDMYIIIILEIGISLDCPVLLEIGVIINL